MNQPDSENNVKFELELKDGENLESMIRQFERAVNETGEVYLTSYQAVELLAEIKFLQTDNELLQKNMDALRRSITDNE